MCPCSVRSIRFVPAVAVLSVMLPSVLSPAFPTACAANLVKEVAPVVKISDDFAKLNIKSIRMPPRPNRELHPVKAALFDAICSRIKQAGYELAIGSTIKPKDFEGRASLTIKCDKGSTLQDFMDKHGIEGNDDAENYMLQVSFKIEAKLDGRTREAYSAKCKMWHKFVPQKTQNVSSAGAFVVITYPIDYFGEGPDNLNRALLDIPDLLMKELPTLKTEESAGGAGSKP